MWPWCAEQDDDRHDDRTGQRCARCSGLPCRVCWSLSFLRSRPVSHISAARRHRRGVRLREGTHPRARHARGFPFPQDGQSRWLFMLMTARHSCEMPCRPSNALCLRCERWCGSGRACLAPACCWTALRRRFATTLCRSECIPPSLRLPEGHRPVRVSANCILLHVRRRSDPVTRGKRGQLSADSIIDGGPIGGREPSRLRQEANT